MTGYSLYAYLLNPIDSWIGTLPAERWVSESATEAWILNVQPDCYGEWTHSASGDRLSETCPFPLDTEPLGYAPNLIAAVQTRIDQTINTNPLAAAYWTFLRQRLRELAHADILWEGDGTLSIAAFPDFVDDSNAVLPTILVKQDNNGSTFAVTPVPIVPNRDTVPAQYANQMSRFTSPWLDGSELLDQEAVVHALLRQGWVCTPWTGTDGPMDRRPLPPIALLE